MISIETQDATVQQIIKVILKAMIPDQIILIAYIDQQGKRFSILFDSLPAIIKPSAIYLLIISSHSEHLKSYWSYSIEQRCSYICDVSCAIFSHARINNLSATGNRLIVRALQSGIVLFQKWEPAPHIRTIIQQLTITNIAITDLYQWHYRSHLFYQTANFHREQGILGMTAFCIHQATEQLLMLLHIAATGKTFPSHNLNGLLRRLRFYYDEIAYRSSNRTAAEEKKLIQLNLVYVNFRYHDVHLEAEDIEYFFQELNHIQSLADRCFQSPISLPRATATATQGFP